MKADDFEVTVGPTGNIMMQRELTPELIASHPPEIQEKLTQMVRQSEEFRRKKREAFEAIMRGDFERVDATANEDLR